METAEEIPWLILTLRYEADVSNPTREDLVDALREIYSEDIGGMTESDYSEHPNTWLRYGTSNGPMYILDVYRNRQVRFGQWTNQEYEDELAPEVILDVVPEEHALQLWTWLANGELDRVKAGMNVS